MKHRRKNGDIAIEILDLPAKQPTVVLSDRGLESFCWAPDGPAHVRAPFRQASFRHSLQAPGHASE
jgi:hypothetical protein